MSFWNTCILAYCRLGIAGLSPKAPGTAGSALAALLAPLLFLPLPLWGRLLFLAVIVVTGGLAATRAEILLGRTDPGEVVIDELVGVWIALLPLGYPAEGAHTSRLHPSRKPLEELVTYL